MVAVTPLLFLSACGDDAQPPTPTISDVVSPSPSSNANMTGDMPKVVSGSDLLLPPIPADVSQLYSEEDIRSASEYAIAFSRATAYVDVLWQKTIEGKKGTGFSQNDIYFWAEDFTDAGKTKLLNMSPNDYDTLFILPSPQPGDTFPTEAIRPLPNVGNTEQIASAKYKISQVALGPVSEATNEPSLALTVEDYEYYDWMHEGKWVAVGTTRIITYDMVQSTLADHPWLIENWTPQGETQAVAVKPFPRSGDPSSSSVTPSS